MSIRRRIWSLPIISTVIFGIGLGVSATYTTQAFSSIQGIGSVDYPALELTKTITDEVTGITEDFKTAVAEGDKNKIVLIREREAKLHKTIAKYGAVQGKKTDADRVALEFKEYMLPALTSAEIMLGAPGDPTVAVAQMQSTLKKLQADLEKISAQSRTQFANGINTSSEQVKNVLYISIISALIVILALISTAYFVIRSIWGQLGGEPEYARSIASAVAKGDLSMDIAIGENDNTSLLAAISQMKDKLKELLSDIKTSSATIKNASAEIAAGNADLSERTEKQSINIESTSRSIHELTVIVNTNDEHASKASAMASDSANIATRGGQVVQNVVATMDDINQSAKKIADITSVIDGIAFQTNILALNAAVEAARAGEQGRGFAVVASEVRNLAQRSASAAKEIKDLINDSVNKVNAGSLMVNQAGTTMTEIVSSIKKVSEVMADITSASKKQSAGISDVNASMEDMDHATQQNAALVEEAASAAKSLEDQAIALHEALSYFKIKDE